LGRWTRRQLLDAGLLAATGAALPCCHMGWLRPPPFSPSLPRRTPWPEANAILDATALPAIPDAVFAVSGFGAKGDGRSDAAAAVQAAIDTCAGAGGGHVTVPAGRWLVGALRLRSRVDLHLEAGATLLFSDAPAKYPPVRTRFEGIECVNRSPMIYADRESDVALTGEGTLDASRAASWNQGGDREGVLEPLVARGVQPAQRDVTGRLRTSMVQPHRCARVLVQGVKLVGAQFWQLHPVLCRDVTIEGVTTSGGGPNTDACDPESCERVVIRQCSLPSGDDNVALKSGRDADGRRVGAPCRDVVVMNCQAEGRFGFLTLGSELTGGIENVYAHNLWTYGRGVARALWIKSNSRRGGAVRNVRVDSFRGVRLGSAVMRATMRYGGQTGEWPPSLDGIELSRFEVTGALRVLDLEGLPANPIGRVRLADSRFTDILDPVNRLVDAPAVVLENVVVG
jgi:polygalacturonase